MKVKSSTSNWGTFKRWQPKKLVIMFPSEAAARRERKGEGMEGGGWGGTGG